MRHDDLPVLTEEQLRPTILNPAVCAELARLTRRAVWRMEYETRRVGRLELRSTKEPDRLAMEWAQQQLRAEQEAEARHEAWLLDEIRSKAERRGYFFEFATLERAELRAGLKGLVRRARLNRRARLVLSEVSAKGRAASDVASDLGVCAQRVYQIRNEALRRLRAQVDLDRKKVKQ